MSQWVDNNTKTLSEERLSRQALKAIGGELRFLLVVLVSVLALAPQSGHASPVVAVTLKSYAFTVNTTADTHDAHPGDGVCVDKKGKCSLRTAIEEADALPAGSSITITVPSGTYKLTLGTLGLTAQKSSFTINGASSKTTLISGNHSFRVMSIAPNVSATLSQLTIEGGSATKGGGGIFNSGTLTVTNSTFSGNGDGGAISNYRGTLIVTSSTLSKNSAIGGYGGGGNGGNGDGGGISNYRGTLIVTNSTFSGNSAKGGNGGNGGNAYGGAIYNNRGGRVSVSNSTLSDNSATGGEVDYGGGYAYGGGIENNGGTLSVSSSTLSGNSATGGYGINTVGGNGNGGGIDNTAGMLTVTNSTLSDNSATGGYGNYAGGNGNGGGIENDGNMMSVSNSTLSGNAANSGGNGGNAYGGGIENGSGTVTLTGTIVANTPSGSNCSGTITETVGYNLDSDGSCGFSLKTDLNNTNPKLGPLRDNGGPTQTMALLKGSKAIDWVAASSCPATDQRGYTRPDNGESMCDIGAYESSY